MRRINSSIQHNTPWELHPREPKRKEREARLVTISPPCNKMHTLMVVCNSQQQLLQLCPKPPSSIQRLKTCIKARREKGAKKTLFLNRSFCITLNKTSERSNKRALCISANTGQRANLQLSHQTWVYFLHLQVRYLLGRIWISLTHCRMRLLQLPQQEHQTLRSSISMTSLQRWLRM